jgi:hypothetical protein
VTASSAVFEALGTLNRSRDSMEAIMLAGEVDFLLCHCRVGAPTRFDPDRFQSIAVGSDTLVPVSAPVEGHPVWPPIGRSGETDAAACL